MFSSALLYTSRVQDWCMDCQDRAKADPDTDVIGAC